MITTGVALALACGVILFFELRWFQNESEHDLTTLADVISDSSQASLDFGDDDSGKLIINYLHANPNIVIGCLYRTNGTIFAKYTRPDASSNTPPPSPPRSGFNPKSLELTKSVYNLEGKWVGIVYLRSDLELQDRYLWRCIIVVGASILLASIAALLLSTKFERVLTKPIFELLGTTKRVSEEKNYAVRATRSGKDELGDLVDGFNEMLKQIQTRDVELGNYRQNLEEQVAAQTRDLAKAYKNLIDNYEQLKKSEGLRDSLTQMIIHDLRSPLTGVMQMVGLLKMSGAAKLDKDEMECIEYCHHTCSDLADMITSMLDISRIEAREMPLVQRQFDLRILVKAAVDPLRPLLGERQFDLESPNEPIAVYCDSDLIRRVISNLVGNAIKFTSERGRIWVSLSMDAELVRVVVQDNGPGIPQEFHEKIFEKFGQVDGQARRYSSGLGLTFCKLAVERHGGQIGLRSGVDKGSTFWFALPIGKPFSSAPES